MIDVMHDTIRIYNLQEVFIRTIPRPMLPSTFVAGYNTTHHDPQKYFDSLSDDARPQDGLMCGERLQYLPLPKILKKMVAIVAGPSLSLKVEISSHHLS